MPKLATPLQYEPTLEGLNDIRPLQLADEGKVVVPYPVLCKNPPTTDRPAVGKLARCSQRGALLKSEPLWANKWDSLISAIGEGFELHHFVFTQTVYGVVVKYVLGAALTGIWWCNEDGSVKLTEIIEDTFIFLSFVGRNLYIIGEGGTGWGALIDMRGFYK